MVAAFLAWDRRGRLRPLALQDPTADDLLCGMPAEPRYRSWHLVLPAGEVRSGGQVFAPLLRLLPVGRPLAILPSAAPRLTERLYRAVADRRTTWGPLVPASWHARAQQLVDRRSAMREP